MRKIIVRDQRKLTPFNEPARELRVLNKPLWLHQRDVLARYCKRELAPVDSLDGLRDEDRAERVETIVYRDNLFFDQPFIDQFIADAQRLGKACRVAFNPDDRAILHHALQLQRGIRREGNYFVADLWYFPYGVEENVRPLLVDTLAHEHGYYRVPSYMANEKGDLTYWVPQRAFASIEHWVHLYVANCIFGLFARGARMETSLERPSTKLSILFRAMWERRQVLRSSPLVQVGKNTIIDPSAVIHGPTTIGDNCTIGAGTVIDNCVIGNGVNIGQGCQLMLSVVCDRNFLPFNVALFMTTIMENSIVAQNTCLQMCVLGRDTFIGANNVFTDYNLLAKPIKVFQRDQLVEIDMPVLGGCVGHNCRLGSGLVIYPARTVESDTILFASKERRIIDKNVTYEESDHLKLKDGAKLHRRDYPREIK
jgi:carbonic anhydrase/acetyltransferase-like protein (isoleucine patch superfamily)